VGRHIEIVTIRPGRLVTGALILAFAVILREAVDREGFSWQDGMSHIVALNPCARVADVALVISDAIVTQVKDPGAFATFLFHGFDR
jgi:hypothetical protein